MADVDTKHEHHDSKVRFSREQDDNCNKIHVIRAGDTDNGLEIHAGFFKTDHKYEVIFDIVDHVGLGKELSVYIPPGTHLTASNIKQNGSGIVLVLEYFPKGLDGIVNECFFIKSKDGNKEMKGVLRAEVLGHGQGTPMLKDGVRCLERPHSSNSSVSS